MTRNHRDLVRAALAAGGWGAAYDPSRVQKLIFLLDRQVAGRLGGPFFDFQPHDYGPFDPAVYRVLEQLAETAEARVDDSGHFPRYVLTEFGHGRGLEALASFPSAIADSFRDVARWIRLFPYRRMLSEVFRKHPDMAVNSVVGDLQPRPDDAAPSPFLRGMARAFDLTATLNRTPDSRTGLDHDREALADTWWGVGEEIEEAMASFAAPLVTRRKGSVVGTPLSVLNGSRHTDDARRRADTCPLANWESVTSEVPFAREQFSGPLPHPEHLEHYERVIPGAADHILSIAEHRLTRRHADDSARLKAHTRLESRSQWTAFAVGLSALLAGGVLLFLDRPVGGLATLLIPIGTIIAILKRPSPNPQ